MKSAKPLSVQYKLYLKSKHWGVGGNRIFVISTREEMENIQDYDSSKEYVYKGYFPLYVKVSQDTLVVYTYGPTEIPSQFKSTLKVKQVEIDNAKNYELMFDPDYINADKMCN
jgi:hypothetical protein